MHQVGRQRRTYRDIGTDVGNVLCWAVVSCSLLFARSAFASTDVPLQALRAQAPHLYELYQTYRGYRDALRTYASGQGFRGPYENLATVVHEMIHLGSASHQGYFVDGVYYEPYLTRPGGVPPWPDLKNRDVYPYIRGNEKGNIFAFYMPSTPDNGLGNVVDEISAHAQVAAFVCENEPESGVKQVRNLVGHLYLQEAYLRVLRLSRLSSYRSLLDDRESRGVLILVARKAHDALRRCGLPRSAIPAEEFRYFEALVSSVG